MEQAAEVCVDLEYYVILNNANEDAGGRLDTAAGENHGGKTKSCSDVVMSPDDDDHHPLKANEVENMNTASSVMVLIDEGAAAGDFIVGGGGGKEKRIKAKKPPKPPKPQPHGGDHHQKKLIIKELAELAMIKRARIERMKALIIQKKAAPSKNSSSSGGNLFAMLFTILVFLVLLFQGMSCQISCGTFTGSPPTTQANESSFIFIQEELNPSAHDSV